MNFENETQRKIILDLSNELLRVEEDRLAGLNGCCLDELGDNLDRIIQGV